MRRLKRALALPPQEVVRRVAAIGKRRLVAGHDRLRSTYSREAPKGEWRCPIALNGIALTPSMQPEWLMDLCRHYLAHRFDLLGSGWVQVRHGTRCRGLEGAVYAAGAAVDVDRAGRWLRGRVNYANLAESRRIWGLVDESYAPIDWQLDFKSGYRWSECTWYAAIPLGHLPGVDIKVPWELARMQHASHLALAFGFTRDEKYSREFRNQTLDFIANNPPRFGVNWHCAMDVAIRTVNWLLAYDLFRAVGARFDTEFEQVFRRSVYEHGRHIAANLEWHPTLRTNHYLANIVGLLFIAAYLPRSPRSDAWLAFSLQELVKEVESQFNEEGSNFEGSVCYHRLSSEMVFYAAALAQGLSVDTTAALHAYDHRFVRSRPALSSAPLMFNGVSALNKERHVRLPHWFGERMARMASFTEMLTKQNGQVAQIGDNDSGRFVKLSATYERMACAEARRRFANLRSDVESNGDDTYWCENHLDHRHLAHAAEKGESLEKSVLAALRGSRELPVARGQHKTTAGIAEDRKRLLRQQDVAASRRTYNVTIPGASPWIDLALTAYPQFGVYLFRSRRVFLAVRCGTVGQNGVGGHAHNDQLSIELQVDGHDWLADPGTYLYTSSPSLRNAYRSVCAHAAPRLDTGAEPGSFDEGLFKLGGYPQGHCRYFGDKGFIGSHAGYGVDVYRAITLTDSGFDIVDWSDTSVALASWTESAITGPVTGIAPSPGYGVRLNA
ncbi:MAG TPA: alginate lyase family protein [Burkholderiales bacterium]|nr:alginate lyase family protein [Burkholderiales bacterium]